MIIFLDQNDDLIVCIAPSNVVLKRLGTQGFEFITNYSLDNVSYGAPGFPSTKVNGQTVSAAPPVNTGVALSQQQRFDFGVSHFSNVLDEFGNPHGATFLDTLDALCVFLNFQPGGGGGSGEVNTASNLGALGEGVFAQKTGVDLEFKKLIGGTNVTLTSTADNITIDAAGGGTGDFSVDLDDAESTVTRTFSGGTTTFAVTHSLNTLDVQAEVYRLADNETVAWTIVRTSVNVIECSRAGNVANNLFRVVLLKSGSSGGGGGGGEVNTASNVGTGEGVFKQKTGVDLEFKSFVAGSNITFTPTADEIQIDAAGGESNTASNVGTGAGVFKQKTGVDLEMRSISSSDFDVTEGTDEIEIQADPALITNKASTTPAAGMQALVEDSGSLKKVDVNGFLVSGGGEPFFDDTIVTSYDLNDQTQQVTTTSFNRGTSYVSPILFQIDVLLKKVKVQQTNSNSQGSVGYLGVYEYQSKTNSGGPDILTFDKVYQEPTTYDFTGSLSGVDQTITLTTPYTLEAGKMYVIVVLSPDLISASAQRPTLQGRRNLSYNKNLGLSTTYFNQKTLTAQNANVTSGVMPASIVYNAVTNTNSTRAGFVILTVQNA